MRKIRNISITAIGIVLFLSILNSCNNSELNKLQEENLKLSRKVDSLSIIASYYKEQQIEQERQEKIKSSYNNQKALKEFKNHVDFYCKNCDYKDFKVRKYSDYAFDISMTKRSNDEHISHSWTGVVIRLTFQSDGKFTIQNLQGTYDFGCQ